MRLSHLAGSEDEGLPVRQNYAELVINVLSWARLFARGRLCALVDKAHRLDLIGSQVYGALSYARLVKVVVIEDAFAADCHVSLVQEYQSFLAQRSSHQNIARFAGMLRLLALLDYFLVDWLDSCSTLNFSLDLGNGNRTTALEVSSIFLLSAAKAGWTTISRAGG